MGRGSAPRPALFSAAGAAAALCLQAPRRNPIPRGSPRTRAAEGLWADPTVGKRQHRRPLRRPVRAATGEDLAGEAVRAGARPTRSSPESRRRQAPGVAPQTRAGAEEDPPASADVRPAATASQTCSDLASPDRPHGRPGRSAVREGRPPAGLRERGGVPDVPQGALQHVVRALRGRRRDTLRRCGAEPAAPGSWSAAAGEGPREPVPGGPRGVLSRQQGHVATTSAAGRGQARRTSRRTLCTASPSPSVQAEHCVSVCV